MAQFPIEIVEIGDIPEQDISLALTVANETQREFFYQRLGMEAERFGMRAFARIEYRNLLDNMLTERREIRGYHPYLLAITDSILTGDSYSNLFWGSLPNDGLAVVTIANVPDIIVPRERLAAYFVYHLAFAALHFLAPSHETHEETRGCVFDFKENKKDLLKSMRPRAICDECRESLLKNNRRLSSSQFRAIDALFEASGRVLKSATEDSRQVRPRAFIGSSREGLKVARKLQALLEDTIQSEVWDQGTTFGLGQATLESLEKAVTLFEFGVFVFTPDDELQTRGETKAVARDNVVFELGLFVGKLTRQCAFVVRPRGQAVSLPSDLAGIMTAQYDAAQENLNAALGPACERIREAVERVKAGKAAHLSR